MFCVQFDMLESLYEMTDCLACLPRCAIVHRIRSTRRAGTSFTNCPKGKNIKNNFYGRDIPFGENTLRYPTDRYREIFVRFTSGLLLHGDVVTVHVETTLDATRSSIEVGEY